jgi:hypothetical protein
MTACVRYLVLCVLALIGLNSAAHADQPMVLGGVGVMGGPGGGQFVLMCPRDSFLVGSLMRRGYVIDYYEPICAYVQPDGGTGPHFSPFSGNRGTGGDGGGLDARECAPGSVVSGLNVYRSTGNSAICGLTGYTDSGGWLACNMLHSCRRVSPPFQTATAGGEIYNGVSSPMVGNLNCPPGQWAMGVYGRSGVYIDSIGPVCGPAFSTYATAHLPPPPAPAPKAETVILSPIDKKGGAGGLLKVLFHEFPAPVINGAGVDACLHWGTECGDAAANEFCRRQGYTQATDHSLKLDSPPTLILGDNAVCSDPGCDRFAAITCR